MNFEVSNIVENHRAQYLPYGKIELILSRSDEYVLRQRICSNLSSDPEVFEHEDERIVLTKLGENLILKVSSNLIFYNTGILISNSKKVKRKIENLLSWKNRETKIKTSDETKTLQQNIVDESVEIHRSMFPANASFEQAFRSAEIYFKPFKAPGGDFYWVKNYQDQTIVVLGDCTGHGMQGALIAMSAMTLLKQFFQQPPNSLKESIIEYYDFFYKMMEDETFDHFDLELGIIKIDKKSNFTQYYGSGINLIHKSGSNIEIFKSRKKKFIEGVQEQTDIASNVGDQFFLFTDGITDQFNAQNNRKLGINGLNSILMGDKNVFLEDFSRNFDAFKEDTSPLDDQAMLILTI